MGGVLCFMHIGRVVCWTEAVYGGVCVLRERVGNVGGGRESEGRTNKDWCDPLLSALMSLLARRTLTRIAWKVDGVAPPAVGSNCTSTSPTSRNSGLSSV